VAMPGVEAFEIWLFQRVVDHVLLPKDISAMYSIALLYVGLSLLGGRDQLGRLVSGGLDRRATPTEHPGPHVGSAAVRQQHHAGQAARR